MNAMTPIYRNDIGSLQFAIAVIVGSVGSAALSFLHVPGWASVGFALALMMALAISRLMAAAKFKDFHSLEAFAEDSYLMGYLLTLAALLGLVPRLISDEANLFQIAGLKLVTTVVGLAVMMIFRQIARRWAVEEDHASMGKFARQQQLFSDAVARLNQGADDLTSKLNDIVQSFDPALLTPLAEWSNRAAGAFSTAASALVGVPASVENGVRSLTALTLELERAKLATEQFGGVLASGSTPAVNSFGSEIGHASQAAIKMCASVTGFQVAGEAGRESLQRLGDQVDNGTARFGEVGNSLHSTVLELAKVERALKKMVELHANDPDLPMTRMVEALKSSATITADLTTCFHAMQDNLQAVANANKQLAGCLESKVWAPMLQHQQTLDRVQQQLVRSGDQIERIANQFEGSSTAGGFDLVVEKLLTSLGDLRAEMSLTNAQMTTLVSRLDGAAGSDGKTGFFRRFVGGGTR